MEDRRHHPSVGDEYRTRLAARRATAAGHEQWHVRLSWTRLTLIASAVALFAAGQPGYLIAAPVVAFLPVLFVHARVLNRRDDATRAAQWYERGLARLEDRWRGQGARGERFQDLDHPYADDLDLFGEGGLFELLVTTRTRSGEERLAEWLKTPADRPTILARQAAVADLSGRLDLREDLDTAGPQIEHAVRTDDLRAWALAAPQLPWRWPAYVLPVIALASTWLMVEWIRTASPPPLLVPVLSGQVAVALWLRHRVHHVAHEVAAREQELRVLAGLLARIDREAVHAPLLQSVRERVKVEGRSPADEVRRLARLVELLSSGHNQIFAPISALLLLGTQLAFAVERWRQRSGAAVPVWLDAVAEYEALCALATYAAEHPTDTFPEIVDRPARLEAVRLSHPLIPPAAAVPNDIALGDRAPQLWLVSGSNMSGKSTWLRTIGLNVVLAQAGAPVRAQRMVVSPLAVGATLRIQDSLIAGRSRFFAEITRVGEIVRLAGPDATRDVLFLLDELLSGTNSHDRLLGATGILSALIARGAIGLATTHDLALAGVVDRLGDRAANVHFEDRFRDGALSFDYLVRPGVVRTSNAIALMRAVGLDVPSSAPE